MDKIENLEKINNLEDELDIFDFIDLILDKEDKDKTNTEQNLKNCTNCSSINLIKDNGYITCSDCGIINDEILDRGIEYINNDTGNTRVGCPSNHFLPLSSLGTKIGGNNYSRMSLLQNKWYRMVYRERSLLSVLTDIEQKCRKYNINKPIIDNSKILFKKINDSKHKYGKNKGKQT